MANGRIIERLANSPVLDRLEDIARIGMILRNQLNRNPTPVELSVAVAQHVTASPAATADLNMENNSSSRVVRGSQLSLHSWLLMITAIGVAWKTGNWEELANQLSIGLPAAVILIGNGIALFGRLSNNPDPDFRLWKPTSWFRSA